MEEAINRTSRVTKDPISNGNLHSLPLSVNNGVIMHYNEFEYSLMLKGY